VSARQTGFLIIVVGLAAALLAALANPLGIGRSGFGWHQVVLLVAGVVLAVVGAVVVLRAPSSGAAPGQDPAPGPDAAPGPDQ
jgi:uncharacterized membrane protein